MSACFWSDGFENEDESKEYWAQKFQTIMGYVRGNNGKALNSRQLDHPTCWGWQTILFDLDLFSITVNLLNDGVVLFKDNRVIHGHEHLGRTYLLQRTERYF